MSVFLICAAALGIGLLTFLLRKNRFRFLPGLLSLAALLFCLLLYVLPGTDSVQAENQALAELLLPPLTAGLTGAAAVLFLWRRNPQRRLCRWIGLGLLAAAAAFFLFALQHPERSFPGGIVPAFTLYASYLFWTILMLWAPARKKTASK